MAQEQRQALLKKAVDSIVKKYKDKIRPDQLVAGIGVEREHSGRRGSDTRVIPDKPKYEAKIALAHLKEIPDYYTKLKKYVETGSENK